MKEKKMREIIRLLNSFNSIYGTDFVLVSNAKYEKEQDVTVASTWATTEQETLDTIYITMHNAFGWGPERMKRLHEAYCENARYLESIRQGQSKYYKHEGDTFDEAEHNHEVEEALKQACGPYYQPREVRYGRKVYVGSKRVI